MPKQGGPNLEKKQNRYQVVSSLFLGDKSDAVFSFSEGCDEAIVLSSGRGDDLAFDVTVGPVHVEEHRLRHVRRHRAVGHVGKPDSFGLVGRRLNVNLEMVRRFKGCLKIVTSEHCH